MLTLSKTFNVSIDYLVNDEMNNEQDSPIVKSTAADFKLNYQYILVRVIVAICVIVIVLIVGILRRSLMVAMLLLSIMEIIFLIYYGMRLLMLYFSNKKEK